MTPGRTKVKDVDITPDRSLIPKLGKGGYTLAQALGELVDNSIEAKLSGHKIRVAVELDDDKIRIIDDASGMTSEDLASAMTIAYRSDKRKQGLGEFGIGMKAACMALGRKFRILTRPAHSDKSFQVVFDEDEWIQSGDWSRFPIEEVHDPFSGHGTVITIEDLRLRKIRTRATGVRDDFGVRYSPLIREGALELRVNDLICRPFQWKLHGEASPFEFTLSTGDVIHGWWGLLEEGSLGKYGFNLYHRGRLVRRYEKLGFAAHPDLAHLVGELHMDAVPVTFNKREFIETSSEYEEALERFREPLELALRAARVFKLGQPSELPPAFLNQIQWSLESLSTLEEWPELTSPFRVLSVFREDGGVFSAEVQRGPKIIRVVQRFIKGQEHEPLLQFDQSKDGDMIVNLNSAHPAFLISKNRALLISWAMIEGLMASVKDSGERRIISAFLRDRDRLLGEMIKSIR